jgi:hypothetical protein
MVETHTTCFFTGININRVWKDDKTGLAVCSYLCYSLLNGSTPENAHIAAKCADMGRLFLVLGFQSAFNKVTNEASVLTGSKLVDNSRIYHSDANYNFKTL